MDHTPFEVEEIAHRYIVGIDLGTTNSAVGYVDRTKKGAEGRRIRFFDVPQLITPGEVGHRPILPSFLYLPGPYELPPGSTALPWAPDRDYVVGEFAREQGALVPGRLVASAKSWLSHSAVDRTAAILPWGAGADVKKVSPVEAAARYLQHIREAWNEVMARGREGYRLEEQLVVLTVPASFDEVARELTVAAAREAGLPRVVLVEEPLAAFYAWLSRHEEDWEAGMESGQIILVCDVGGGTTDFTIVAVREGEQGLRFDRLAVGEHLMLGGDNMDLTLARNIEVELLGQPGQLDSKRWHQLWHQCRKAKEVLLSDAREGTGMDSIDVTVVGTGRKLIADTLKSTLTAAKVRELTLEGFFPFVSLDEAPHESRRRGLTEWGLPYVQDPSVTRHLAAFWNRFRTLLHQETGRSILYPDFLLFNGGALTPALIRKRILDVVQSWFQAEAGEGWAPVELENPRPELAVAIGAAYYGLVRLGEGVRVGAGSPRAYYVEVAGGEKAAEAPMGTEAPAGTKAPVSAGAPVSTEAPEDTPLQFPPRGGTGKGLPSQEGTDKGLPSEERTEKEFPPRGGTEGGVPGSTEDSRPGPEAPGLEASEKSAQQGPEEPPGEAVHQPVHRAVCLIPRGTEEGFEGQLVEPSFQVLTNQPVAFQLFSSSTRLGDHIGDVVDLPESEITALPPIKTVLRFGKKGVAKTLPVRLAVHLTAVGTLELWCESQQTPHRWQLQFDVRQEAEPQDAASVAGETLDASLIEEAQAKIRAVFSPGSTTTAEYSPQRLVKDLASILDFRKENWPTPLIRKLADTLLECGQNRAVTPAHEARWFNLLGYCLRPGFGDPVDEWRMKEVWKIYPQGLQYARQAQNRVEWWVFWRRTAGGLTPGQQWHIYQQLSPALQAPDRKKKAARKKSAKMLSPQEEIEVRMMLANFERLPAGTKEELGSLLLERIEKGKPRPQDLWALSRLGARIPFYGPLDRVVPARTASQWLDAILSMDPQPTDALAQALVQLARRTGDRERDLPPEGLDHLTQWLEHAPRGKRLQQILTEPQTTLAGQEQDWIFGESLPSGLIIAVDS